MEHVQGIDVVQLAVSKNAAKPTFLTRTPAGWLRQFARGTTLDFTPRRRCSEKRPFQLKMDQFYRE
jgi:hypothetical protein